MKRKIKYLLLGIGAMVMASLAVGCRAECEHDYGTEPTKVITVATCTKNGEELWTCGICGEEKTESTEKASHTYAGGEVIKEATCIETGIKIYACTNSECNAVKTEILPVEGHNKVNVYQVDPTCTTEGWTAYTYCADCNTELIAKKKIPALGHSFVPDQAVEPTCTESGLTAGIHCAVCKEVIKEQTVILAKGHSVVTDKAVLPLITAGLILLFVWAFMMGRMNSANPLQNFGKARTILGIPDSQKVTFDDVAGADEEKEELREVVDFLRNPDKFTEIGARIPHGLLLVGPPGTGKTLLARAVAGEANVQFLSISGSDFVEMYVGVGASRVRDLFDQAKKVAPAIIFIDEIDAVGRKRGSGLGGGHDEKEQTLNQLLVEMDGFSKNEGVIVLAATNRPDILDPALLRPGRFDRQIHVGHPDVKGREEILKVHAKGKRLDESVSLKTIARATSGFTGADLSNLLNEAAILAARENRPVLKMDDLNEAMMKIIAGPAKRSRVQQRRDLKTTAIHEAGHAVATYKLPTQDPVRHITIIPRGQSLGSTWSLPKDDSSNMTRNEMYEEIVSLLGGRVAEALFIGDISVGASNDIDRATKLAKDMVARYGMCEKLGTVSYLAGGEVFIGRDYQTTKSYSESVAATIDEEVKILIDKAYAHCKQILEENADKLHEVVAFLLERESMTGEQFEACMEGKEMKDSSTTSLFDGFEAVEEAASGIAESEEHTDV